MTWYYSTVFDHEDLFPDYCMLSSTNLRPPLLTVELYLRFCSIVQVVCTEGPDRIRELIAMGASFDHGEDGNLHLAREGGHSHHRIVHAADMTGREIERALLEAVINDPNIFMFEHHFAIDLLTSQVCFLLCFLFCSNMNFTQWSWLTF